MVKVEGPFTLLSPREMDSLRAMGVDLEHCDYWVVGDGGEALLADTSGGEWLPGIWGRDFYPVYAFVWRGVLLLANIDWRWGDDGTDEYDVYALSRPEGLPADWYKADFGDVGLLGETVEPDMEMLQVLAAMLRIHYRGWLSYGGVWPDGVTWYEADRHGLKVRGGEPGWPVGCAVDQVSCACPVRGGVRVCGKPGA